MGERSIIAYFQTPEEAQGVAAKLKAMRAIDVSVDRFDGNPGAPVDRIMNPITGGFGGLPDLVLDAEGASPEASVLLAADPSASGMSDGGQDSTMRHNIVLAAVVDESIHEKALKLIEQAGGAL